MPSREDSGFAFRRQEPLLRSLRLVAVGATPHIDPPRPGGTAAPDRALIEQRPAYFGGDELVDTPVYDGPALAAGSQHGYGIITDIREISGGRVRLRAGTLYTALDRLRADKLIEVDREEIVDHRLRRYYGLTPAGRDGGAIDLLDVPVSETVW